MALPIVRCWDLTDAHVREAIGSRRAMGQLLKDMAAAARPGDGAPKILLAIARLADPACDWVEGFVRVEIDALDHRTQISITEDIGGGLRELLFPRLVLDAPLEELERSLRLAPQAVEPLVIQKDTTRLVLVQPGRARAARSRPSFELAEDCLRDSLPPSVRDSVLAPLPPPSARAITPAVHPAGGLPPNASTSFPVHEAPTRRQTRPAQHPRPRENGSPPIMEIPRAPKFLDFGDLAPKPRAKPEAKETRPKAPPPRPAAAPEPAAAETAKAKKPSRLPPKKPSRLPPAKKPSRLPPSPRRS